MDKLIVPGIEALFTAWAKLASSDVVRATCASGIGSGARARAAIAGQLSSERKNMLGIEDKWVALAYVLCIAASVLCIVYGLLRWNKGDEPVEDADQRWVKQELKESEEV